MPFAAAAAVVVGVAAVEAVAGAGPQGRGCRRRGPLSLRMRRRWCRTGVMGQAPTLCSVFGARWSSREEKARGQCRASLGIGSLFPFLLVLWRGIS